MRNYDEMSGFDINKAVQYIELSKRYSGFSWCDVNGMFMLHSIGLVAFKDYCNNPSDAWPIIESIWWKLLAADEYGVTEWARHMRDEHDKDKLRAAMIVFLKMKEQEND